jgi:hypothetical protein
LPSSDKYRKKIQAYLVCIISEEIEKDTVKKVKFLEYLRDFISYNLFCEREQNEMKNQFDFIFETDICLSEKKRLAHDYKEQNFRLSYFDSLHNCMPNRNYLKVFGEELTHCSKPFILFYFILTYQILK